MKPTEDLHQLIRSMSGAEKRYFRIYSSRHTIGQVNNYVLLFDAIGRQDKYNEQELKHRFRNKTFIRHLPSEKNYLYRQVLDSLNACHREKTFLSRYAATLTSIEILYNRGLFEQCRKLIRKAKKEAYRLERLSILLLLLRWETLIHIKDEHEERLNESMQEELRVMETMRVQVVLMRIAFSIQVQIDKGKVSPSFINRGARELKKNLPSQPEVNSFWAQYYYHSGIGLLSTLQRKHMTRYHSYKAIKLLMDTSPQFIVDLPGIYHLNLNNLVNILLLLRKYREAELLIRQQRGFLAFYRLRRPALARMVFLHTYENELFLHYCTGDYEKGAAVSAAIENEVKKISASFSPLLFDLIFMMAVTALMVKNYKAATRWLNRVLSAGPAIQIRKELHVNVRLLFLVVLYESRDLLLENRLENTRRFLLREKQFGSRLKIIEVIRMLSDEESWKKNKNALKKYAAAIRKESKRTNEESLNKQFDFAGWIDKELRKIFPITA